VVLITGIVSSIAIIQYNKQFRLRKGAAKTANGGIRGNGKCLSKGKFFGKHGIIQSRMRTKVRFSAAWANLKSGWFRDWLPKNGGQVPSPSSGSQFFCGSPLGLALKSVPGTSALPPLRLLKLKKPPPLVVVM
jgi:hypothetical protein